MGMTIHQSGRDHRPGRNRFRSAASAPDGKSERAAGEGDCGHPALAITPCSITPRVPGRIPPNRGEPGIVPDSIEVLGPLQPFPQRRKLDGDIALCLDI